MTREEMLTGLIHQYGFEHEAVIQFARLMEDERINDETLEGIYENLKSIRFWGGEDEEEEEY